MSTQKIFFVILPGLFAIGAFAQGTLVFDQQSTPQGGVYEGIADIQSSQPIGQSFTPSLDAVGFIQLFLINENSGNNAVVYVNLFSGSITGQNIGQSAPVTVNINSEAPVNFFFSTPVAVTPGTTYYLQPVVQSGDAFVNESFHYQYSGGSAIFNGTADPGTQLSFGEGIVSVPEPSTWAFLAVGGAAMFLRRRKVA